jgi:hypothetical protein
VAAIREFGFGGLGISAADFAVPNQVVQLGQEPNRIDLMTSLTGVTADEVWRTREKASLDGVPVNFIGRAALLRNKDATGRSKDRIDAEELRRIGPGSG